MVHYIILENISPRMLHEIRGAFRDGYSIKLCDIPINVVGFNTTEDDHKVVKCTLKYRVLN